MAYLENGWFVIFAKWQNEWKNDSFQAVNCLDLFRNAFKTSRGLVACGRDLRNPEIFISTQNCILSLIFMPFYSNSIVIQEKMSHFSIKIEILPIIPLWIEQRSLDEV